MKRKTKPQITFEFKEYRPPDVGRQIASYKWRMVKAHAQMAQLALWDDEFERQRRLQAKERAERFWSQIRALEGKS